MTNRIEFVEKFALREMTKEQFGTSEDDKEKVEKTDTRLRQRFLISMSHVPTIDTIGKTNYRERRFHSFEPA